MTAAENNGEVEQGRWQQTAIQAVQKVHGAVMVCEGESDGRCTTADAGGQLTSARGRI
jgi:hypothetical protein